MILHLKYAGVENYSPFDITLNKYDVFPKYTNNMQKYERAEKSILRWIRWKMCFCDVF